MTGNTPSAAWSAPFAGWRLASWRGLARPPTASTPAPPHVEGQRTKPGHHPGGHERGVGKRRHASCPPVITSIPLLLALLLIIATRAMAVEPSERLADPALEARARTISATLRCLVCQNESVDDSGASLAHDIRILVRERLAAGDTDAQARQAIVDRYGDFVLLKPPINPATYVLWFGPAGMLAVGMIGTFVWLRRRTAAMEPAVPLDAAERRRLERMLQETDG